MFSYMDAHATYEPTLKGKSGAQEEVNLHIRTQYGFLLIV